MNYCLCLAKCSQRCKKPFNGDVPALQCIDSVSKGSPADLCGLKPGDFVLEVGLQFISTLALPYE